MTTKSLNFSGFSSLLRSGLAIEEYSKRRGLLARRLEACSIKAAARVDSKVGTSVAGTGTPED